MTRQARQAPGGYIYHVLNRGVNRQRLFVREGDYAAFERVMAQTLAVKPMRLLAYCLMPNHWHLVLWPEQDGQLAAFMGRLTTMHVTRWQEHFHCVGHGHVYQGRFKSFAVERSEHFLSVCRYVELNALRCGLVEKAEDWRWCSLWRGCQAAPPEGAEDLPALSRWPLGPPANWVARLNQPESAAELEALRLSMARGRPYGSVRWQARTVAALGLEHTLRHRGRPRKAQAAKGS